MKALDHYYDDAVCAAETIEEMKELLAEKFQKSNSKIQ